MIDVLRNRRSIRKYEKKGIDTNMLDILKEALLRCPSSRGINPWVFIFVDDRDLLHRLSHGKRARVRFSQGRAIGHSRLRR